jgi:hypothetical protein
MLCLIVQPVFCFEYYNFKTRNNKEVKEPIVDYSPYIPQNVASQGLYKVYIEMGNTPEEAAIKVMKVITHES